ncbi:MAG: hypothetical protein PHI86_01925 [Candidatus Omnitrophica bacterium]|nr:hypothetical protein [Candidatus Omnitrophota bacterium]HOX55119.1 hypothetical protein [Candidatus Omnitrophota bacterium]
MRSLVCLLLLALFICGCASIEDQPEKLITDSNFTRFEQKKSNLESQYLNKEISYSEYQVKLGELEYERLKSEQEREEILFR